MTAHPFDALLLEKNAAILLTPCPGTKEVPVKTALEQLKMAGASGVITMMPSDEMKSLDVESVPEICKELGMRWFQFPVIDDSAPDNNFHDKWISASDDVHSILDEGGTLAIHCRGGSGRTGFMVAIILLERGMEKEEVIAKVREIRPKSLSIESHMAYLSKYY